MHTPANGPSIEEKTTNVALFLNKKLHARARLLTDSFNESPESIATTDFAEALSSTDLHLMSFLTTLTQSVRQSKRNLFADTGSLSSISPRSCRLFYALSVLQFCTNSTCCVPLHALLAETVMCHGGTLELVHILNRLGAVASVETVNRLATHIVHQRLSTGVQPLRLIYFSKPLRLRPYYSSKPLRLRPYYSSKPLRLRPYYSSKPLRLRPYFFKPFRKHITPNTLYYVHT